MGKGSTPSAPDYERLAREQGEISENLAAGQTWANRPNQYTPWGDIEWGAERVTDPATGEPVTSWSQYLNLNPMDQAALDYQRGTQLYRSGLGYGMMGRLGDELGEAVDYNRLMAWNPELDTYLPGEMPVEDPTVLRGRAEDAAWSRSISRLDPLWEQRARDTEITLRNRGLRPGDQAYDDAMANLGRERTDAYQTAVDESLAAGRREAELADQLRGTTFGQQLQRRQQGWRERSTRIAQELQRRGWSLNEVTALLNAQQIGQPSMPGFQGASRGQAPDLLGAAESQYQSELDSYNARQAQMQGMFSGLTNLALGFA